MISISISNKQHKRLYFCFGISQEDQPAARICKDKKPTRFITAINRVGIQNKQVIQSSMEKSNHSEFIL